MLTATAHIICLSRHSFSYKTPTYRQSLNLKYHGGGREGLTVPTRRINIVKRTNIQMGGFFFFFICLYIYYPKPTPFPS